MPVVPRVTTLRVRPVIPESVPQQSTWGLSQLATAGRGQAEWRASLALPTVQITSRRSEADVLAVFRRLQEEQPSLFGQATLKHWNLWLQNSGAVRVAAQVFLPQFTAQVGPFASEEDAAAACRVLQAAADIRCLGRSGLK
jgi:hypothetical protein